MRRAAAALRVTCVWVLSSALAPGCAPSPADQPGHDGGTGGSLPVYRGDGGGAGPSDGGGEPRADAGLVEDGGSVDDAGQATDGGAPSPPTSCAPDAQGARFGVCDGRLTFDAVIEGDRFGVAGRIEMGPRKATGPRFGVAGGEIHVP